MIDDINCESNSDCDEITVPINSDDINLSTTKINKDINRELSK